MLAGFRNKPRVLIFGTGSGGAKFYKLYHRRYNVVGFLDNDQKKHGQRLFGKVIMGPHAMGSLSFDKIIIASDYYREIHKQLLNELAVPEQHIGFSHAEKLAKYTWVKSLKARLKLMSYQLMTERPGFVSSLFFLLFSQRHDIIEQGVIKRLPLRWLDEMHSSKIHVFRESMPGKVQGPRFVGEQVPPINIVVPEVALYHFQQASAHSATRSLILRTGELVFERVLTSPLDNADYSGGHVLYHSERHALVIELPSVRIEKGVLINGCAAETNYYHWLLEVLTQLQFIAELPEQYADYPILISAFSQKIPSIKTFLSAFNIERSFIFLDALTSYRVDDLLFINAPNNLIANLKDGAVNITENGFVRSESIDYLRSKALPLISDVPKDILPKRVFMARRNYLRLYNQSEIFSVLEPFGFTSVFMEDLDFSQQVALMVNAEVIVGPTGAAWGNILFASQGTKALCWMAQEAGGLSCFSNLADVVGVDMDYVHYLAGTSDSRLLYSKEYRLDKNAVQRWADRNLSVTTA